MNKVLAHICNHRIYLPLLQQLNGRVNLISGSFHENIFDIYHKHTPSTVIFPVYEYTQEFHQFVDTFKDKVNIIIFMGDIVHKDLAQYCNNFNIKTIKQNSINSHINLGYEHIYDSTVFHNLNVERNDKILTILHSDNAINHNLLDNILYPNTKLKIVTINNPEFKHVQNIGVANSSDISLLFNQYNKLLDLTGSYLIEAQACGIPNLALQPDIHQNIENNTIIEPKENIEQYSIQNFINNNLLKFIEA